MKKNKNKNMQYQFLLKFTTCYATFNKNLKVQV